MMHDFHGLVNSKEVIMNGEEMPNPVFRRLRKTPLRLDSIMDLSGVGSGGDPQLATEMRLTSGRRLSKKSFVFGIRQTGSEKAFGDATEFPIAGYCYLADEKGWRRVFDIDRLSRFETCGGDPMLGLIVIRDVEVSGHQRRKDLAISLVLDHNFFRLQFYQIRLALNGLYVPMESLLRRIGRAV
jgi:hypothetical protein